MMRFSDAAYYQVIKDADLAEEDIARDLELLQACGYRMERACCVDMFPWTANVETVALLTLKIKEN